jgi:hypothetical protein
MKLSLILTLFLFCSNVNAQLDKLIGIWITPENELMAIHDTINQYDNSNMLGNGIRDEGMSFFIKGDTLSFQKRYFSSRTDYKILYVDRYDLKIIKQSDTTLIVQPVSKLSKAFYKDKTTISFTRQEFARDKSIKLEKIIFHTSSCFGTCPTYHLQIDSIKQAMLYAEEVFPDNYEFKRDSSKMGYFTGTIADTTYNKLISLLETCNLSTLEFDGAQCCDGSVITIIVYYNGQRKYLQSMFPPAIADSLISYLYAICARTALQKTKDKFIIEE